MLPACLRNTLQYVLPVEHTCSAVDDKIVLRQVFREIIPGYMVDVQMLPSMFA